MAPDPLKRSRQRQGPSLTFHTIGVQGYFSSVQPPFQKFLDPPLFNLLCLVAGLRSVQAQLRNTELQEVGLLCFLSSKVDGV